MSQIEFIYNGVNTVIQCNRDEKLKDICQRFKLKVNLAPNKLLFYSYNGRVVTNDELKFVEIANTEDKNRNQMNVIVIESDAPAEQRESDIIKSKNIICPKCKENIKMDIKDFKVNLYDCKNGHKIEHILLNEFEETQNIDQLNIVCDICKRSNKSTSYNNIFFKCNTCNKNICPLCKPSHEQSHKVINYDDKYYICDKHNENYILYCEDCKLNLCTLCNEHKNHKRINFVDFLPRKEKLIEKKNELKDSINLFKIDIKILINLLNELMDKMDLYYKINEDIINNYDIKNRNYETLYYLNEFLNNNIIDELKKVTKSNTILDKFNNLFNIYNKMNVDEITLIYNTKLEKEIKLFGGDFVEKYQKCCKLIIDGKEQKLKEKYAFGAFSKKKENLEIKLKGITNITNMNCMFYNCKSLISLPDLFKWNTSNITDMGGLFYKCSSLKSLPDISIWKTSNVSDMRGMFRDCSSLSSLPDICEWNTSNVNDMSGMFSDCSSLISLPDISKWDTKNVTFMNSMFYKCSSLKYLPDISKWNISKNTDLNGIFYNCSSLFFVPDISKWNTANVTNMSCMFYNCPLLSTLPDLSKWNISKVTDIRGIFYNCSGLPSLPDISKWNTVNITNMSCMFYNCQLISSLPDISKWNTTNVTDMNGMFYKCAALSSLPKIENWDTSKVTDFNHMFQKCKDSLNIPPKFK